MFRPLWIACMLPLAAFADEGDQPQPIPFSELYPPLPGVTYYCTDNTGQRAELGQIACFTASCRTWMARCEMTASNRMAMWREVQDGCPAAETSPSVLDRLEALKHTL